VQFQIEEKSFREIAQAAKPVSTATAVEKAVRRLAKDLHLELRSLRRGRPRRK